MKCEHINEVGPSTLGEFATHPKLDTIETLQS